MGGSTGFDCLAVGVGRVPDGAALVGMTLTVGFDDLADPLVATGLATMGAALATGLLPGLGAGALPAFDVVTCFATTFVGFATTFAGFAVAFPFFATTVVGFAPAFVGFTCDFDDFAAGLAFFPTVGAAFAAALATLGAAGFAPDFVPFAAGLGDTTAFLAPADFAAFGAGIDFDFVATMRSRLRMPKGPRDPRRSRAHYSVIPARSRLWGRVLTEPA